MTTERNDVYSNISIERYIQLFRHWLPDDYEIDYTIDGIRVQYRCEYMGENITIERVLVMHTLPRTTKNKEWRPFIIDLVSNMVHWSTVEMCIRLTSVS